MVLMVICFSIEYNGCTQVCDLLDVESLKCITANFFFILFGLSVAWHADMMSIY